MCIHVPNTISLDVNYCSSKSLVRNSLSARITRYQSRASTVHWTYFLRYVIQYCCIIDAHWREYLLFISAVDNPRNTPSPLSPGLNIPSFPRADSSKRYLHKLGASKMKARQRRATASRAKILYAKDQDFFLHRQSWIIQSLSVKSTIFSDIVDRKMLCPLLKRNPI